MQFSLEHIIYGEKIKKILRKNKTEQILYALKNNNIENIYFADDMLMNHLITNDLIKELYPNMKIVNIIPGTIIDEENMLGTKEKGLVGVNKILNTYIEKSIKKVKTH